MDFIKAVLRLSYEGDQAVKAGQKALEQIQKLVVKTIAKYEGVPHALTLDEMAPIQAICDQLGPANCRLLIAYTNGQSGLHALCSVKKTVRLKVPDSRLELPKHVHYKHIYEDQTFSIGIFILPPGVAIPLHDHPRMSVISRVLYGSVYVKAYDLIKHHGSLRRKNSMARLRNEKHVIAPHTMVLLPDCGNLHELIGGDDIGCAFLDIITPPYSHNDGRECAYFRVVDSADADEKHFVLESYEPMNFYVIPVDYDGPQISRCPLEEL
ncbi:hypothetical protein PsorP6_016620 [Peronosclerospora sorghi]|uniref:Uncharacterized protein n=1 Tax=Peronosclerospora sorghi TaxID=230839 RepID=A0ACC0VQ63_9STRA|nr:hypothetical protein PsorP6_019062 [Peronosclerospora sorghi]KAI9908602.1 hypothetical protein PsorP6_016620 [Peronosclerospora sorghi]